MSTRALNTKGIKQNTEYHTKLVDNAEQDLDDKFNRLMKNDHCNEGDV
jgi:hypothetical protein